MLPGSVFARQHDNEIALSSDDEQLNMAQGKIRKRDVLGDQDSSISIIENNVTDVIPDGKLASDEILFAIPSILHGMAPNDVHQPKAFGFFGEVKSAIG